MKKRFVCAAAVAALVAGSASTARAQTLAPLPDKGAYVSIAVGGQPTSTSFSGGGTFASFAETGRYDTNQNIGPGLLFDVAGGYHFSQKISAGLSVWNARSKSSVAGAAAMPDPAVFNKLTTVNATPNNDLNQSTLGVNLFVAYSMPVGERFDLTLSGGPTLVRTSLEVGTVTPTPNSQKLTIGTDTQTKTGGKAGNAGADLTYRANATTSVGLFVRYAGGQLDLPAVKGLKVGSVQTGALLRYRF